MNDVSIVPRFVASASTTRPIRSGLRVTISSARQTRTTPPIWVVIAVLSDTTARPTVAEMAAVVAATTTTRKMASETISRNFNRVAQSDFIGVAPVAAILRSAIPWEDGAAPGDLRANATIDVVAGFSRPDGSERACLHAEVRLEGTRTKACDN